MSGIGRLGGIIDNGIQQHLPASVAKALGATGDLQNGIDQAVVNDGTAISGPQQYQSNPVHQLGSDVVNGHPLDALHDAAGVVAGAAPYAAAALIPGAGPAILGGSAAGNTISDRMQTQGESSPSLGDVGAGIASGALNAVGGGIAHGVTDSLGRSIIAPAASRALGPLANGVSARMLTSAVVGGGLGAANNIENTAGTGTTTAGGVLNSAVEGAGTGALAAGIPTARGALQSVMQDRGVSQMHPETAASTVRVADMAAQRVASAKLAGQSISPGEALKTIGQQITGELQGHISNLSIPSSVRQAVIGPLMAQAKAGTLIPSDAGVSSSPLAQLDALGLPADAHSVLRNGLIDLSMINRDGNTGQGLLQPIVAKMTSHSTVRALEVLAGATAGAHAGGIEGGLMGGAVGMVLPAALNKAASVGDHILGTTVPPVVRQRAMAQAALAKVGQSAGGSSLDALQAARQAASEPEAAPSDDVVGKARAAVNQQGMVAKFGQNHPIGQAAAASLIGSGNAAMVAQAQAQYDAMQGVRDAAPAGVAVDAAGRHQLILDAAEQTPGGLMGIDAVNAAQRQLTKRAQATLLLAGKGQQAPDVQSETPGGTVETVQTPPATMVPGAAQTVPTGSGESSSGDRRATLGDYLNHTSVASPSGVSLSPEHVEAGLNAAAAAGDLTPDQHAFYTKSLMAPLDNPGGVHNGNLNTIMAHAVASKTGEDLASGSGLLQTRPKGSGSSVSGSEAVRSPIKYGHTVATNQAHLNDVAEQADAAGDTALADAARSLRVVKSVTARRAIRDNLVAKKIAAGDLVGAARVKTLLPDDLINAGG